MNSTLKLPSITLLWAFVESGLGGLLHAFSIPFSGVLLGGMSAFCLFLLGDQQEQPHKNIGKAWAVVMAVKYTVSPHSPLGAYLAMSLQTLMAIGIMSLLSFLHWKWRLGIMTFLNIMLSAVQKIFVLTLIFGMTLWDGIDKFLQGVLKIFGVDGSYPYSAWLVGLYFAVYFLSSIVVIVLFFHTLQILRDIKDLPPLLDVSESVGRKKKRKFVLLSLFLLLPLVFVIMGDYGSALYVLGRSVFVLALGWLILLPLLRYLLRRLKKSTESNNAQLLSQTLDGLPEMSRIARSALEHSKISGRYRVSYFLAYIIAYLSLPTDDE